MAVKLLTIFETFTSLVGQLIPKNCESSFFFFKDNFLRGARGLEVLFDACCSELQLLFCFQQCVASAFYPGLVANSLRCISQLPALWPSC